MMIHYNKTTKNNHLCATACFLVQSVVINNFISDFFLLNDCYFFEVWFNYSFLVFKTLHCFKWISEFPNIFGQVFVRDLVLEKIKFDFCCLVYCWFVLLLITRVLLIGILIQVPGYFSVFRKFSDDYKIISEEKGIIRFLLF